MLRDLKGEWIRRMGLVVWLHPLQGRRVRRSPPLCAFNELCSKQVQPCAIAWDVQVIGGIAQQRMSEQVGGFSTDHCVSVVLLQSGCLNLNGRLAGARLLAWSNPSRAFCAAPAPTATPARSGPRRARLHSHHRRRLPRRFHPCRRRLRRSTPTESCWHCPRRRLLEP